MLGPTAAVVLNYRTAPLAVRLVQSLQRDSDAVAQIILVDNASADGSLERFARELSGVDVIASPANGGFPAGCNLGIRVALARGAAQVLLLNSDVVLEDTAIAALAAALDDDLSLGMVGPLLVSTDDPAHVESAGIRFTRWSGRMRHRGAGERRANTTPDTRLCDGVSGCAVLIRRQVFDAVGLFDEDYFYGFEDLDLCLRARAAGFTTACVRSAVVRHQGQASIGRGSARRLYFAARNHLLLANRCACPVSLPARWIQTTAIIVLNLTHALFTSPAPLRAGLMAVTAGLRDYTQGRFGAGSSNA